MSGSGAESEGTELLSQLARRLDQLEAERDIARLIAAYGPLVDSGNGPGAAAQWEPDGVYDVDPKPMTGADAIEAMVGGAAHQAIITGGSAHFLGPHHITVDGDRATAVGYSLLVMAAESQPKSAEGEASWSGDFRVARATSHHWHLRRGPNGWRVVRRVARLLDGRPDARVLLADVAGRAPGR